MKKLPNKQLIILKLCKNCLLKSFNSFLGEEITENYYPYYTHMPRRERIPWLFDHYRFNCDCVACENDFPTRREMKDDDLFFRCQKCRYPIPKSVKKSEIRCEKCSHVEADSERLIGRVHELNKEIEISQQLYFRDLTEEKIRELNSVTEKRCAELGNYLCTPTKLFQDALEWNSAIVRRIRCSRRPGKLE